MALIVANLRLNELVPIVNRNKAFHDAVCSFLRDRGYRTFHGFIHEKSEALGHKTILACLEHSFVSGLYDGLGRPYEPGIATWYFLAWCMRDAPAQRLNPLVQSSAGASLAQRRATVLNKLRSNLRPLFPEPESWTWHSIAEVMLARLEGSRRALKGNLFEGIVRKCLETLIKKQRLKLKVSAKQVQLGGETYDVTVAGKQGTILLPVKTRETMGGGHALLFTRDIFKSVAVASEAGYDCIPIIIAESWSGDLASLKCERSIIIKANPNQIQEVELLLCEHLEKLVRIFAKLQ